MSKKAFSGHRIHTLVLYSRELLCPSRSFKVPTSRSTP